MNLLFGCLFVVCVLLMCHQRGYLRDWLHELAFATSAAGLRADFPGGLQLTELTASLRDGFAMLVVPILRATSPCTITAFTRQSTKMRSEEHTSELQSLMRISYAVFCLKKKNQSTSYKYRKHRKK